MATAEVESDIILATLLRVKKVGYWESFLRNPNLREAITSVQLHDVLAQAGMKLNTPIQIWEKEEILNLGLVVARTPSLCRIISYSSVLNLTQNNLSVVEYVVASPEFLSHCDIVAIGRLIERYPNHLPALAQSLLQLFDENQGDTRTNKRIAQSTSTILTRCFIEMAAFRAPLIAHSQHYRYLNKADMNKALLSQPDLRALVNANEGLSTYVCPPPPASFDKSLQDILDEFNHGMTFQHTSSNNNNSGGSSSSNNISNNNNNNNSSSISISSSNSNNNNVVISFDPTSESDDENKKKSKPTYA